MQNAVFNPRRTANGIKVEPFAEGIAKVEAQLAQQRINAQQTQKLAGMTGAEVGKFAFAKTAFEDPVKRGNVGLPRRRTPVQIIIDIKRRTFTGVETPKKFTKSSVLLPCSYLSARSHRRRVHPYAIGRQTAKTGIDQSVRQRQGIAANIKIAVDTAIFLPPQPALAQRAEGPASRGNQCWYRPAGRCFFLSRGFSPPLGCSRDSEWPPATGRSSASSGLR
jgi:hypothetical protein